MELTEYRTNGSAAGTTQAGQVGSIAGFNVGGAAANSGFLDPNTAPSPAATHYSGSLRSRSATPESQLHQPGFPIYEPGFVPPERRQERERENRVVVIEESERHRRRRERRGGRRR